MADTTVTYTFDADEDGWIGTDGSNWTTVWSSSIGNPSGGGVILRYASGTTQTSAYYELTTTWASLGISSEQVITNLQIDVDWRCGSYRSLDSAFFGPIELRDSGGSLVSTLDSGLSVTGTTTYVTRSTSTIAVPLTNGGANDTVKIRITATADGQASGTQDYRIYLDNIDLNIDHRRRRIKVG